MKRKNNDLYGKNVDFDEILLNRLLKSDFLIAVLLIALLSALFYFGIISLIIHVILAVCVLVIFSIAWISIINSLSFFDIVAKIYFVFFRAKNAKDLYFKYYWQENIVRLKAYSKDNETAYLGTGVFIDGDGTMITSAHILTDKERDGAICDKIECSFCWGWGGSWSEDLKIVAYDEEMDIAVLKKQNRTRVVKKRSAHSLFPGEEVYLLGNSGGQSIAISQGIITSVALTDINGQDLIQTTVPTIGGNSGGPLFDKRGRLLGILRGSRESSFSYVIPIDTIMDFIKKNITQDSCMSVEK